MPAMSLKQFTGMTPRQPDYLLEDNAASYAQNCDFSRSMLQPLKGGLQVIGVGGTIRAMYTNDGIYWYTWGSELTAHKSPVINEIYNRLYYIEGGVPKVSVTPEFSNPPAQGGPPNPALTWNLGVPNPIVPPTLKLIDRVSLADYPAATIEFSAWYSDGTANFGVTTVAATPVSAWKRYSIPVPDMPTDAPAGAVLVVQAIATEDSKQLFSMNTGAGATAPATSSALPGGISMSLEVDAGGGYFANLAWGVVETRAYVFTTANTWDEESGPSPVSLISPTYLQDVEVTITQPDYLLYRPWKQNIVYRTYGGSQYIRAGITQTTVFLDSARTVQSSTGTALPSLTWLPPRLGMFGLVLAPNGWFAAFRDNILYMSEPYRPHTWQYSMTFAKSIVGICVGSQVIVVTTVEATYIVTGPHPASVTSMTVPIPVGGISHRSMCAVEGGISFLSNDGIVVVEGSQASLDVNHRYFTREVWRSLFGNDLPYMTLAYHDGCLVAASFQNAVGFVLELDEAGGAMTRYDYQHTALMRLPVLDTLYYAQNGGIYRFREGNALDAQWYSKQFITPVYTKFGIGFARMSGSGQITVKLYAEDVLIYTQVLNPALRTTYFRLPSQVGSTKWQARVSMTGPCVLQDLSFAQSPAELRDV